MTTTREEGHVEEPGGCEEQVGFEVGAGVEVGHQGIKAGCYMMLRTRSVAGAKIVDMA